MKKLFLLFTFTIFINMAHGQAIYESERYVPETDPLVLQKIKEWQNIKFGLLMHWGTYSQWGIVESWSLCPEDYGWCERKKGKNPDNYFEYKKEYENLQTTFNPINFNPDKWAEAAKYAGMKYVIFTTKHHDGFCMFDTKYTDYKVTSDKCPFHSNPKANIAKEIFDMDIIWLDGGWVAKESKSAITSWYDKQVKETKTGFLKHKIVSQDIHMDEIVKKMREKQPGLIVVDRAVHGINQNYLTPENRVPDKTLPYPWESCIISGGGWSYTPNAKYMSGREGIQMLVDVVAKGGNLLLNIAPVPDGTWQQGAYDLLKEFGDWMKVNSEAIYNSKPIEPYKENNICMTKQADGTVYFIYLAKKGENKMPAEIKITSHKPAKRAKVTLLGYSKKLKWKADGDGFVVSIPEDTRNNPPSKYAWTIKVTSVR